VLHGAAALVPPVHLVIAVDSPCDAVAEVYWRRVAVVRAHAATALVAVALVWTLVVVAVDSVVLFHLILVGVGLSSFGVGVYLENNEIK